MPELPEVETVVRELKKSLVGHSIVSFDAFNASSIRMEKDFIFPFFIKNVSRRCKFIIFESTNNQHILTHLRMTGKYLFQLNEKDKSYCRVQFNLDSGNKIYFVDIRKFGRIDFVCKIQDFLKKYGRDAIDTSFTKEDFYRYLQKKHKAIKSLLLEQDVICGIGNIYADEALFLTKIMPLKKASDLSKKETDFLLENIQRVLHDAINNMGTTLSDYRKTDNSSGENQNYLLVYGQKNCKICHSEIQKIKIAGRGSHFCATCQHF
jgi:formamidopyrimidine-DNA glycosylase